MSPSPNAYSHRASCFPRPRGDEPKSETFRNFIDAFSPPARG